MGRRKGELTAAAIDRGWSHQVAVRATNCRGSHGRSMDAFCLDLSVCERHHSVFHEDKWWVAKVIVATNHIREPSTCRLPQSVWISPRTWLNLHRSVVWPSYLLPRLAFEATPTPRVRSISRAGSFSGNGAGRICCVCAARRRIGLGSSRCASAMGCCLPSPRLRIRHPHRAKSSSFCRPAGGVPISHRWARR
jgi:hypothetical protein